MTEQQTPASVVERLQALAYDLQRYDPWGGTRSKQGADDLRSAAALIERLSAEREGLAKAADALLTACYRADEDGDLSDTIDGELMHNLSAALTQGESRQTGASGWQDIATAPRDGTPILGWCVHDADPYFIEPEDASGRSRLTIYGAHTEGLSHVEDGAHVIAWGGSWDDSTHEYSGGWMPDWWFRADSEFEVTANPTHWMTLPAAPTPADGGGE